MANYLIGYVDPKINEGHEDPLLSEFTYGDYQQNGRKLRNLNKGDFLFFHTTIRGKRYITAYFVVEQVMVTADAKQNTLITTKYSNPHLSLEEVTEDDTIVFGNPITSYILKRPFELSKTLLNQLSRKPNFNSEQTDLGAITSALRAWKELSEKDVQYLLQEIQRNQLGSFLKETYLTNEEIEQIEESDIERFISANPEVLGVGLTLFKRQLVFDNNTRLDLLLKHKETQQLVVVEIKKGALGKEVYKQISGYISNVRNKYQTDNVTGIIVGSNILPMNEEFYLEKIHSNKIKVFLYAWKFSLRDYNSL